MPSGTIKVNKPPPPPIVGPPPKSTKYKGVKHTIMVMSGKGGVGKSTIAVNLAVTLAKMGLKVGVIDADINGPDDPKMLGVDKEKVYADESGISPVDTKYGVKVISMAFLLPTEETAVVWRGALRHKAIQQFIEDVVWKDMDYVILDLPPGTGDEALSISQIVPEVEGVVIVITPQDVALLDAKKAINFADQMKIKVLGIVENMSGFVCPHCGEISYIFKTGGGEKAAIEHKVPFLGRVPLSQDVVETADEGIPIVTRNEKIMKIFEDIVSGITQQNPA